MQKYKQLCNYYEHDGALQDTNNNQILVRVIAVDFLAEAGNDFLKFFLGNEDFAGNEVEIEHEKIPPLYE